MQKPEFIAARKEIEDIYLQHFDKLYNKLRSKMTSNRPNWKTPKWIDTWRYQGLTGLGSRLFRGTDPKKDNMAWRLANAQKEGKYNNLKIYSIFQEECNSLVESEINEDDLEFFRAEIKQLLSLAMFNLYELGKKHGLTPEETLASSGVKDSDNDEDDNDGDGNDTKDVHTPDPFNPPESKVDPTLNPNTEPPVDKINANTDTNTDNTDNVDDVNNDDDFDPTAIDDENLDKYANLAEDAIPSEILEKLSKILSMEKVALIEERIGNNEGNDDERKLNAIQALVVLYEKLKDEVGLGMSPEQIKHARMTSSGSPCLKNAKIGEDELNELNEKQIGIILHLCEFLRSPIAHIQNWMLPEKIAQSNEVENEDSLPPGEPDMDKESRRGEAMTLLLQDRFIPKGKYMELVKKRYKPNLWFAARNFPKTADDLTKDKDKLMNWPKELNCNSLEQKCVEGMLDLFIAIVSGDLFGPSHVDPSSQQIIDLMKGLVSGPEHTDIDRYQHQSNIFEALRKALEKNANQSLIKKGIKEKIVMRNQLVEEAVANEIARREETKEYPRLSEKISIKSDNQRIRTLVDYAKQVHPQNPGEDPEGLLGGQHVRKGEEN